jgi:hypothetical protein
MSRYSNSRKENYLERFPVCSLSSNEDRLAERCKFNFSYYCVQEAGQAFDQWTLEEFKDFVEKLGHYSARSLKYWENQRVGKSGTVLSIYGAFPKSSDFTHPKHVPHEVRWGRFRLDFTMRLVGFVVPEPLHGTIQSSCGAAFDSNTFYVVFLDGDHRFWKGKEEK